MLILLSISIFCAIFSTVAAFCKINIQIDQLVNFLTKYATYTDADILITNTNKREFVLKQQLMLSGFVGLIFIPLALFVLSTFGLRFNFLIYIILVISACVGMWYITCQILRDKAKRIRSQYRYELVEFLESLILIQGGRLTVENALDKLFEIMNGALINLLKVRVYRATNMNTPIYVVLEQLSRDIDLIELRDISRIVSSVENRGAQIVEQLSRYKDTLLNQLESESYEKIRAIDAKLSIPSALLVFTLLIFLAIPSIMNLISESTL